MLTHFLNALDSSNVTVITANQRLSTCLQQQFTQQQLQSGFTAWQTADILPLKNWITRNVDAVNEKYLILSERQELIIWEKIIHDSLQQLPPDWLLINPATLATTVQQAWKLLKQWRIPLQSLNNGSDDAQMFYHWAKAFAQYCQQQQWLDQTSSVDLLIEQIITKPITLPTHIVLAGFEEIPPQIQQLLNTCGKTCQIHHYDMTQPAEKIQRIALLDETAELYCMAQWARLQLAQNPKASIACVIPQLDSIRTKVVRIFSESLANLPFNISGGSALRQYPLVETAFQLWQLATTAADIEQVSCLLRSPFLGGSVKELTQRASLDIKLRQVGESKITAQTLLQLLEYTASCPMLKTQLNALHQTAATDQLKSAAFWANHFAQQLQHMGWPGERPLNSAEYQQQQRLQDLLKELAGLDAILTQPISFEWALQQLNQLAQRILFQPRTTQAGIQVLGVLEAIGMPLERLWVMGMTDDQWPATAAPNPFIPPALQRQYNIPHSSSEKELYFCQKITAGFASAANEVIFSYSQKKNDIALRMSPLIADYPVMSGADIPPNTQPDFTDNQLNLEQLIDAKAPEIAIKTTISGGASILKDQAACPFRAFAKFRLGASKLPQITPGLSPQERGTLLHLILEQLWQILADQQQLIAYDNTQLQALITQVTHQVLTSKARQRRLLQNKKFLALESQRLQQLLHQWLLLEKQRPPFRVIGHETMRRIQLSNLQLNLRVDREDELADGSRILIDYKTGETHINHWFGERPDEPQLPLYCLTNDTPAQGLLFAQIRSDGMEFKGISADDYAIKGVTTITQQTADDTIKTWDAFVTRQHAILTRLADGFCAGEAQVDPKHATKTCTYCDLHSLCRVGANLNK